MAFSDSDILQSVSEADVRSEVYNRLISAIMSLTRYLRLIPTGIGQSISNLQTKAGMIPNKAVAGWQAELVATISTGLYAIESIR